MNDGIVTISNFSSLLEVMCGINLAGAVFKDYTQSTINLTKSLTQKGDLYVSYGFSPLAKIIEAISKSKSHLPFLNRRYSSLDKYFSFLFYTSIESILQKIGHFGRLYSLASGISIIFILVWNGFTPEARVPVSMAYLTLGSLLFGPVLLYIFSVLILLFIKTAFDALIIGISTVITILRWLSTIESFSRYIASQASNFQRFEDRILTFEKNKET